MLAHAGTSQSFLDSAHTYWEVELLAKAGTCWNELARASPSSVPRVPIGKLSCWLRLVHAAGTSWHEPVLPGFRANAIDHLFSPHKLAHAGTSQLMPVSQLPSTAGDGLKTNSHFILQYYISVRLTA